MGGGRTCQARQRHRQRQRGRGTLCSGATFVGNLPLRAADSNVAFVLMKLDGFLREEEEKEEEEEKKAKANARHNHSD